MNERLVKRLLYIYGQDEVSKMITRWCNARIVMFDADGSIWIEDPQTGHWLSDDQVGEFLIWSDDQF